MLVEFGNLEQPRNKLSRSEFRLLVNIHLAVFLQLLSYLLQLLSLTRSFLGFKFARAADRNAGRIRNLIDPALPPTPSCSSAYVERSYCEGHASFRQQLDRNRQGL
jgi:hypothetical protein